MFYILRNISNNVKIVIIAVGNESFIKQRAIIASILWMGLTDPSQYLHVMALSTGAGVLTTLLAQELGVKRTGSKYFYC